jgi:hypothetical protein
MSAQSYSVTSFCAAEDISRQHLYNLWKQGKGPRYYMVGRVRRISHQARLEWQQRLEAAVGGGEDLGREAAPAQARHADRQAGGRA